MAREEAVKTKNIFVKQVEESKFQLKRIHDYFKVLYFLYIYKLQCDVQ